MEYKLLALDIDGTLVSKLDSPISPKVIEAIHTIKDKVHVSLCTGRGITGADYVIESLGIEGNYHILLNGAMVLNSKGGEEAVKSISLEKTREIVNYPKDIPVAYGFNVNGLWYGDLKEIPKADRNVFMISFHSDTRDKTQQILDALEPLQGKYEISSGPHWEYAEGAVVLVNKTGASKKDALMYVQDKLGIKKGETICIGDMPNDLPMFEASGFKVAMGNALDEVKQAADYIAPPLEEDGVVDVMERFF